MKFGRWLLVLLGSMCLPALAAPRILMVADEIPAMETLSQQLKTRAGAASTITTQDKLPADLASFSALMVYIHKNITETAEKAFIDYARQGGKLILLHHSISSGKRENQGWFPFLNIQLPKGEFAEGAYKYFDPADYTIVDLAPNHYITSHKVKYPEKAAFETEGFPKKDYPAFSVTDTEVYLNHVFTGPRTTLLGIKYVEKKSGKTYMQPTAGWYQPAEKGTVMYFMLGHRAVDFENPVYAQILANAVVFETK